MPLSLLNFLFLMVLTWICTWAWPRSSDDDGEGEEEESTGHPPLLCVPAPPGCIDHPEPGCSPLQGRTVAFTGEMQSMPRSEAIENLLVAGGRLRGSVDRDTTFLVVGDKPGSKLIKAQMIGVQCLSEAEFLVMLGIAPAASDPESN